MSRSYMIATMGERLEIRCQSPGALWTASDNLVTDTKYYTSGSNINRVQSVRNPDGTMAIYAYAQAVDGSQINTTSTGQPNSDGSAIIDGTTIVSIVGPLGQAMSQTITDIASGITLAQDEYSDYDSFSHPNAPQTEDG